MEQNFTRKQEQLLRRQHKRQRWRKVVSVMGGVVVFVTTYALILPAITMVRSEKVITCPVNIHEHTEICFDEARNLKCGYADFVVHVHNEDCYDKEENLICNLPEIKPHEHDESCYTEETVLLCTSAEGDGHQHTDECYRNIEPENDFIEIDENGNFLFSDFAADRELICGKEETTVNHVHTAECYETRKVLTCKNKAILHKHEDSCYEQVELEDGTIEKHLICDQLQVLEHKHEDGCFTIIQKEDESEDTEDITLEEPISEEPGSIIEITDEVTIEDAESDAVTEKSATEDTEEIAEVITAEVIDAETPEETAEEMNADGIEEAVEAEISDEAELFYMLPGELTVKVGDKVQLMNELPDEETTLHSWTIYNDELAALSVNESENSAIVECLAPGTVTVDHTYNEGLYDVYTLQVEAAEEDPALTEEDAAPAYDYEKIWEGTDYTVTVHYNADAELPEDVELQIREIPMDSDEHELYLSRSAQALGVNSNGSFLEEDPDSPVIAFARFFDISFVKEEAVYEPVAPVDVKITYQTPVEVVPENSAVIVHFAETGTEVLNAETSQETEVSDATPNTDMVDTFTFTQGSFSVTGTIVTASEIPLGDCVIYTESNGKYYALARDGSAVEVKMVNNQIVCENGTQDIIWNNAGISNARYRFHNLNSPASRYLNITAEGLVATDTNGVLYESIGNGTWRLYNQITTGIWNRTTTYYYLTFANGEFSYAASERQTTAQNQAAPIKFAAYATYQDPSTPGSGGGNIEKPEITHSKYISEETDHHNGTYTYDLTLTVSANMGSEFNIVPLDVVIIIDKSGSMGYDLPAISGGGSKDRLPAARNAANTLINTLSSNKYLSVRYNIVQFNGPSGLLDYRDTGSPNDAQSSNWLSSASAAQTYVNGIRAELQYGTTNYEAAFQRANEAMSTHPQSDAQTIMIFLTDGVPTVSYDSSYSTENSDVRLADAMDKIRQVYATYFYAVGIGEANENHLIEIANEVTAKNPVNTRVIMSDVSKLVEDFRKIAESITKMTVKKVQVLDVLSDQVSLYSNDLTIRIENSTGVEIASGTNTLTIPGTNQVITASTFTDENGDTKIQMLFPEDYELEDGYTYFVTSKIQPTQAAYDEFWEKEDYPDEGDPGTDAPNTGIHSSEQPGIFSNKEATVTYTIDEQEETGEILENDESKYDYPVIQLHFATLIIEKSIKGLSPKQIEDLRNTLTFTLYEYDDYHQSSEPTPILSVPLNDEKFVYDEEKQLFRYTNRYLKPYMHYYLEEIGTEVPHYSLNTTWEAGQEGTLVEDKYDDNGNLIEDNAVTARLTNTYELKDVDVILEKGILDEELEEDQQRTLLSNAIFTLSKLVENGEDSSEEPLTDVEGKPIQFITGADGTTVLNNLELGSTYYLEEIQAPTGYSLLPEKVGFTITKEGFTLLTDRSDVINDTEVSVNDGDNDEEENDQLIIRRLLVLDNNHFELPETGGSGTLPFTIGGLFITAVSLLYGFSLRRKQERRLQ